MFPLELMDGELVASGFGHVICRCGGIQQEGSDDNKTSRVTPKSFPFSAMNITAFILLYQKECASARGGLSCVANSKKYHHLEVV